jgi:hypothetical protein
VKIRVLRIHHNSNRVPHFASLGIEPEEAPVKKTSAVSRYSILSASRSSISSSNAAVIAQEVSQIPSSSDSSGSGTKDSSIASNLAARRLTIFALAESSNKNQRNQKLRQKSYNGVQVFYLQESRATQEIFGRFASPMKSPHVYSKSMKKDSKVRIIKGDLVKPIPLSSLGLESDYELSDLED